jgi:two-component system, NtrC family, nitrogen regulation response regulator NtrX
MTNPNVNLEPPDTILVVDDEPAVRKTFQEWLTGLGCQVLAAADAEGALRLANQHQIDLAILDWNLGAGADGLHLLQDLAFFHPDVVAILVTGYAQQATPLDAMRMGVRDYLDKNHDLDRPTFLKVVKNQLERIRPAKRERRLHHNLAAFREAVDKIMPLVQQSSLLNDPAPAPTAVRGLLQFLLEATGAVDGVLIVRTFDAQQQPMETCRAYDRAGSLLDVPLVPFANSLAGAVSSLQTARVWQRASGKGEDATLQPFEKERRSILAVPMMVAPGVQVVLELFDKPNGFAPADERLVSAGGQLGAELLRQAFTERQSQRLLLDAVSAALGASDNLKATLKGAQPTAPAPAEAALDALRAGLQSQPGAPVDSESALRLLEAVRDLATTHGQEAVQHCLRVVESTAALLGQVVSPETERE